MWDSAPPHCAEQEHCNFGLLITSNRGMCLEDHSGRPGMYQHRWFWQKWKLWPAGQGKFHLTSYRGYQLEDRNGTLGMHEHAGGWQKWTLSPAGGGKFFITSHRGLNLEDRNGRLGLHWQRGGRQKWTIATADGRGPDLGIAAAAAPAADCWSAERWSRCAVLRWCPVAFVKTGGAWCGVRYP